MSYFLGAVLALPLVSCRYRQPSDACASKYIAIGSHRATDRPTLHAYDRPSSLNLSQEVLDSGLCGIFTQRAFGRHGVSHHMPSAHLHGLATNHTSRVLNGVTPPQLSQFNAPGAGIEGGDDHCKWEGCVAKLVFEH